MLYIIVRTNPNTGANSPGNPGGLINTSVSIAWDLIGIRTFGLGNW
jgi:hypothetical protein